MDIKSMSDPLSVELDPHRLARRPSNALLIGGRLASIVLLE
jgi:hypothetical protein